MSSGFASILCFPCGFLFICLGCLVCLLVFLLVSFICLYSVNILFNTLFGVSPILQYLYILFFRSSSIAIVVLFILSHCCNVILVYIFIVCLCLCCLDVILFLIVFYYCHV